MPLQFSTQNKISTICRSGGVNSMSNSFSSIQIPTQCIWYLYRAPSEFLVTPTHRVGRPSGEQWRYIWKVEKPITSRSLGPSLHRHCQCHSCTLLKALTCYSLQSHWPGPPHVPSRFLCYMPVVMCTRSRKGLIKYTNTHDGVH